MPLVTVEQRERKLSHIAGLEHLSTRLQRQDRSWAWAALWRTSRSERLRVLIVRASDPQSYGLVERWDGNRWQPVYRLPASELDVCEPAKWAFSISADVSEAGIDAFMADEAKLLTEAAHIIA